MRCIVSVKCRSISKSIILSRSASTGLVHGLCCSAWKLPQQAAVSATFHTNSPNSLAIDVRLSLSFFTVFSACCFHGY
jgi:hypothetical protein